MTYEVARRFLFWPVLVPTAVLVVLDYARALAVLCQAWVLIYCMLHAALFVAGLGAGVVLHFKPEHAARALFKTKLTRLFPGLSAGAVSSQWLLEERQG